MNSEIEVLSCMRGYHLYKIEGQQLLLLTCSREPKNVSARYGVAEINEGMTIGYIPNNEI